VFWYRYDWGPVGGGAYGDTLLTVPGSYDRLTAAGRALATVQRWLRGTLVGQRGQAPCRRNRADTYTCVVQYAGGSRTIWWNPLRTVRVPLPHGADAVRRGPGPASSLGTRRSTLTVSYLPVMVTSRR
jgi:hypothetical protein